jgi:hypothetical protein
MQGVHRRGRHFTLGIHETENTELSLTISPNPAQDFVQVVLDQSVHGGWLELTDAGGRKVIEQRMQGNSVKVNTTHLAAGVYLLRVTSANGMSAVKRVVVE